MPLIQVTMVEGRTVEQKHALIRSLSESMADTLDVPLERIRVAIYEISADDLRAMQDGGFKSKRAKTSGRGFLGRMFGATGYATR